MSAHAKNLATLAIAALLVVPAFAALSPLAAADNVPTVSTGAPVPWTTVSGFTQKMYLRFNDAGGSGSGQPDCTTGGFVSPTPGDTNQGTRSMCSFGVNPGSTPAGGVPASAHFTYGNAFARDWNVTGNGALWLHLEGNFQPSQTFTVTLSAGSMTPLTGTHTTGSDPTTASDLSKFDIPIPLPSGATRAMFPKNAVFTVDISSSQQSLPAQLPVGTTASQWTFDDVKTFLNITSDDAYRAATWTGDANGTAINVYRPVDNNTTVLNPPLRTFFAMQSAWGASDLTGLGAPTFSIRQGDQLFTPYPNADNLATGSVVSSLTNPSLGVVTWAPDASHFNYRGWTPAALTVKVTQHYYDGSTFGDGSTHTFAVTNLGIRLAPYVDATTTPSLQESVSHTVPGGSSTTYLLTANNTGGAPDTFRLTTQFVPVAGSPQTGWSSVLGGPGISGDAISLAPGESKLFTLTVSLPFASSGSGTFLVRAASVNDSASPSEPLTLIASIGAASGHDVAVVAPGDVQVDPGQDKDVPVYLWNRGGGLANATLALTTPAAAGWVTNLVANGQLLQSASLANIPAGGIAAATLRVHGPDQSQTPQMDLTINATLNDLSGYSMDRVTRLHIGSLGGFVVQVLDKVNNQPALVELDRCSRTPPGTATGTPVDTVPGASTSPCPPQDSSHPTVKPPEDGVDGILLRTWVSNAGRVAEDVQVAIDASSIVKAADGGNRNCPDSAFLTDGMSLRARNPSGGYDNFTGTLSNVRPGETYELYVLVPINREAKLCPDKTRGVDFLDFTVTATGVKTGALGQYAAEVQAVDGGLTGSPGSLRGGVVLQDVTRSANQLNGNIPLVDISQAARNVVTQGVSVGQNTTFHVRMANAGSWGNYNDSNGVYHDAAANLTFINPRFDAGWNVSVRAVTPVTDERFNPFGSYYALSNVEPSTTGADGPSRLAMRDVELEINVTAPDGKNHTALAGDQAQVTLQAVQGGVTTTMTLIAVIGDQAVVNLHADPHVIANSAYGGASIVYVYNNGSAPTTVTLAAKIERDSTTNPDLWGVSPSSQTFDLPAFHNRTVALTVQPPAGSTGGRVRVTATFVEFRASGETNQTVVELPVDVVPAGALRIDAPVRTATTGPGQPAQFTLNVTNTGPGPINYVLSSTTIPNWTATLSPSSGIIQGNSALSVPFVLSAPSDAVNGSSFQTVLTVQDNDDAQDFAVVPLTVNILGGSAVPSVSAPVFQKTIDRAGNQTFDVQVRNLGNAAGALPLAVRTSEPGWSATIQNAAGQTISSVTLGPNELATVHILVTAPLSVPENKAATFEVSASTPDLTQSSRAVVRALIHDYGVSASILIPSVDMIPGIAQEYVIHIVNTGNDNDTLNTSVILPTTDFTAWPAPIVTPDHIFLAPGQGADIHATLRAPIAPLPSPRAYGFTFYVGTVGGAAVGVPKNATVAASANILSYRALDVDGDGQPELAVDMDKNPSNGFEQFREISSDGVQCVVVSSSRLNGLAKFFLDCPLDGRTLDGIADIWFDPDAVYAYKITKVVDINGDGTPDYLLDTDRDGKIDSAYDSITEKYWSVTEVHALSSGTTQYLVDTNGDGRADYYVDVDGHVATRTLPVAGHDNLVGLDTTKTGKADKYYDPATQSVTGASVANLSDFAVTNWYFVVGFVALVVLTVILIVVRIRGRKPKEP